MLAVLACFLLRVGRSPPDGAAVGALCCLMPRTLHGGELKQALNLDICATDVTACSNTLKNTDVTFSSFGAAKVTQSEQ